MTIEDKKTDSIETLAELFAPESRTAILSAYDIACSALEDVRRSDGTPFIAHPLNVAFIAAQEIGLPANCITAIFLHEAITRGSADAELLRKFPTDTITLTEGLNHIATIRPKDTRLEADNYRKLIVSYSSDPRITVLKLADRLEVMRHLDIFPKSDRDNKVLETLLLYIPLAHQLGLYNMKSELEDIYFRYAEPQQYRAIRNHLAATENDRKKITEQFIEPLKEKLAAAGISYKLKARTKTAFSIWTKMKKQNVGFSGVFDVFAIRFIIDPEQSRTDAGNIQEMQSPAAALEWEHALCWKVFSFVTEKYKSDTSRLRDWISNPKPNGYESLHITVTNEDGAALEVQIRTKRMDETAEKGLASHWSYKGIRSEEKLATWMKAARTMLEQGKAGDTLSPQDSGDDEILPAPPADDIFVFTPTGELRRLRTGSTVLDFAFDIHTNVGCHCTGGKIGSRVASIREELHTGDVVEIITNKSQHPSAEWLNFVVSGKARSKIRQKLKEEEFKNAAEGKELLDRRLRNWKMEISDQELGELMKKWQIRSKNSFYADLGSGRTDVSVVRDAVLAMRTEHSGLSGRDAQGERTGEHREWEKSASMNTSADDILVLNANDVKGLDYKMAKCCHPVYGDDVFGFVTIKDGVKIHRMSCPNAARLIEKYPYRVQKVIWSETPSGTGFQTTLRITTLHENSVITDISNVTEQFRASIRGLNVSENRRSGTYEIQLTISVVSNLELNKVIAGIRSIRSVTRISRI